MHTLRPTHEEAPKTQDPETQDPKVLYDGSKLCCNGNCPVVESLPNGRVHIYDPAKPENGRFECSAKEYDDLLKHAKPAQV